MRSQIPSKLIIMQEKVNINTMYLRLFEINSWIHGQISIDGPVNIFESKSRGWERILMGGKFNPIKSKF